MEKRRVYIIYDLHDTLLLLRTFDQDMICEDDQGKLNHDVVIHNVAHFRDLNLFEAARYRPILVPPFEHSLRKLGTLT